MLCIASVTLAGWSGDRILVEREDVSSTKD